MNASVKSLIFMVVGLMIISSVNAATYTVGSGGNYATIQACANAAQSGDICSIKPGTYDERVQVNNPGVSFVGESYRTATVDGGFVINVANTRIEDLDIHRIQKAESRIQKIGSRSRMQDAGCKMQGTEFRIWDWGFGNT